MNQYFSTGVAQQQIRSKQSSINEDHAETRMILSLIRDRVNVHVERFKHKIILKPEGEKKKL